MTQDLLVKLLIDRGWRVISDRSDVEELWRDSRGISIHALSPNGYILSIQAGFGLHSIPGAPAESYTGVEFAIWKSLDDEGRRHSDFITDVRIHSNDKVVNYSDFGHLKKAIELIERWTQANPPEQLKVYRSEAPHRDIN